MLTINNTTEGYLKDIEIKGNTWQDSENLADIRSVGTKVEGQELYEIPVLSVGENVFNNKWELGDISSTGEEINSNTKKRTDFIKIGGSNVITPCMPKYAKSAGARYIFMRFYDKSKKYLGGNGMGDNYIRNSYTPPVGSEYVRFTMDATITECEFEVFLDKRNFVFEGNLIESTPYQEDKLTILSPTPLECVGGIADRIICKDGVYGVEKNVKTIIADGVNVKGTNVSIGNTSNVGEIIITDFMFRGWNGVGQRNVLCDRLPNGLDNASSLWADSNHIMCNTRGFWLSCSTDINTVDKFDSYLKQNPHLIKYESKEPQFIPLPHDQQIKLRTFADRTHISFEAEIEPTLKAQVPKSLGATVNTHTTQIDNLNKELDRVKKLEESTVSTVTTDKGFTTIAETTGGYFEDVKVEGKTLVNLNDKFIYPITSWSIGTSWAHTGYTNFPNIKESVTYTAIIYGNVSNSKYLRLGHANDQSVAQVDMQLNTPVSFIGKAIDSRGITLISQKTVIETHTREELESLKLLILEGDHTDKDITFFEGLKSVGQGVDEISVSSVNENLCDGKFVSGGISTEAGLENDNARFVRSANFIRVKPNHVYTVKSNIDVNTINFYDKNFKWLGYLGNTSVTTPNNCAYIKLRYYSSNGIKPSDITYVQVKEDSVVNDVVNHKQDKKQILYYNPNTETWEKPVLREWDSIEKHSDGKYYYHKRSEEVVLNGSENWRLYSNGDANTEYIGFRLAKGDVTGVQLQTGIRGISDKFNYIENYTELNQGLKEGLYCGYNAIVVGVNRTKLSTQDVGGFKAWLQANNVTVVYQLAQEEIYECTNLDLITYNGETNLIVSSGAIQPKLELKVHSNISNVVRLLQEKVSVLENNTSSYIITQNRLQLASTYAADSVTFKVDYASAFDNRNVGGYNPDLYNLILSNILVGKDNYDYDKMFSIILDYASWDQISWEQFDELVLLMDIQHNPPIEIPEEDYTEGEIPEI